MISLSRSTADIYIPDGRPLDDALSRVTHLGIGAHQDDLEFMAYHGILECYDAADKCFGGVTCTNGSGSARQGEFANCTDEEMRAIRLEEQREAARVGHYGVMFQLDVPTAELKSAAVNPLVADLKGILGSIRPEVVYTHNPADKHPTHLHVLAAVVEALRDLPMKERPFRVYGCEGWRALDWVNDDEKVVQDVSGRPDLAGRLNGIFASQIAGGKRYDLATEGRRRANATFFNAHTVDRSTHASYVLDLTPLIQDDSLDAVEYTLGFVDRFREDVKTGLSQAFRR